MSRSQDTVRHKKAIRRSIEKTITAFNARKASAVLQEYAQDLDVVTTRGEQLRERDELEDRLENLFSKPDFALQQRLVDLSIRFVRDDVALVHVEIEMSGTVSASRDPRPPHRELSLRVYVQEEGTWRVTAFHNTMVATL
jgi:uncharacterized protein (TIGR02246 family)